MCTAVSVAEGMSFGLMRGNVAKCLIGRHIIIIIIVYILTLCLCEFHQICSSFIGSLIVHQSRIKNWRKRAGSEHQESESKFLSSDRILITPRYTSPNFRWLYLITL